MIIIYFLSCKHFPRSHEHEILVPLSIMGVWKKNNQKSIVDECASHVTLFIQALSLELAGERRFATLAALAITFNITHVYFLHPFKTGNCVYFSQGFKYMCFFLGNLSHSGDLLLWVGVRGPSSVVRRALPSSSQELLGQS